MEADILLLADFANVDAAGKLNVIGAFNRIGARKFPAVHPLMHIVIRLVAELGEFEQERQLKVILFDEDGNKQWESPDIPFSIAAPKGGRLGEFTSIIALQNTVFKKPGRYEYRVFVNQDLKGSIPVDLVQIEQPFEE